MALENKDKIKDLFSSKLQSFEPEMPASLWGRIDQSLSQQPAMATSSKTASTTKALWLKVAAAAAAVLLTIGLATIFLTDGEDEKIIPVATKGTEEPVPSDTTQLIEEPTPEKIIISKPLASTPKEKVLPEPLPEEPESPKTIIEEKAPVQEEKLIAEEKTEELIIEEPKIIIDTKSKGFAIGFSGRTDLYAHDHNQQGRVLTFVNNASIMDETLSYGSNKFKMEHDRPLSFGLTLEKSISHNLSVETGIVYTYLSSTLKSDDHYKIREKQKFHYLGIPVSLNYTFLKYRKLESYISLGGMVQKDIYGTYKGTLDIRYNDFNNQGEYTFERINSTKRNIHQDKLQFSTHFNIGVSYPIYNKLYLYGTFGGAYYFDVSNKYRTIYDDKEFQFDLDLGLKWKF